MLWLAVTMQIRRSPFRSAVTRDSEAKVNGPQLHKIFPTGSNSESSSSEKSSTNG